MPSMSYIKPENIENDMGGRDGKLDNRMMEIFELLEYIPSEINSVLDIGFGGGQIPYLMKQKGKCVSSIGLELESYGIDIEKVREDGIDLKEANIENIPYADNTFDCVIASHVLEHVPNTGIALQEMRRVLKPEGWLIIFLPKYCDLVVAGHINIGWNLGQLMYVLLINGFSIKGGRFVEYGYSLCSMTKKQDFTIPTLRGDKGDIQILYDENLFPIEVPQINGANDDFDSRYLKAINWPNPDMIYKKWDDNKPSKKIIFLDHIIKFLSRIVGHERVYGIMKVILDEEEKERAIIL